MSESSPQCPPDYPPQYKSGLAPFRYLELLVNPNVLIPRPETEGLVDLAIAKMCEMRALHELHSDKQPLRILEIGTGCGAIILSLATELPAKYQIENSLLVATDISEQALEVASENATKLQVEGDICWLQDNLATGLCADHEYQGYFDIIITNPPYIPSNEITALPTMVKDYEPALALDGGIDGLTLWRKIVAQSSQLLKVGGYLFGELHEKTVRQAAAELADNFSWSNVEVKTDLAQRPRYVSLQKQVALSTLVNSLHNGQIGILPTDTVYGLVMAAQTSADTERFAHIKQRTVQQPLVLLLAKPNHYLKFVEPKGNYDYLKAFTKTKWPGPTTLVVLASGYAQHNYASFVHHTEGGPSIALRVPKQSALQTLICQLGCPLASSSANKHGELTPPTSTQISAKLLAEVDFAYMVASEGSGAVSEIIDCTATEPRVIRSNQ